LAAVKAIAWSPHHHGLLASGGGAADQCIRFWNTLIGQPMHYVNTGSQVSNLAWSKYSSELVSIPHFYNRNDESKNSFLYLVQVLKYLKCRWLRHYATSRKVAGSSPNEVIEFFFFFLFCLSPSSHTMALGFTQPLTEMSIRRYF
jgi:WD40 repeat protein